jgi:hypothetical protein
MMVEIVLALAYSFSVATFVAGGCHDKSTEQLFLNTNCVRAAIWEQVLSRPESELTDSERARTPPFQHGDFGNFEVPQQNRPDSGI